MLPAKIVQAYSETGSLERTAARCGIAPNTVKAVLTRNPEDFATAKKVLATRMLAVSGDAVEIAGQRISECSAPQAAVVSGIFSQRATELLQGQSAGLTINVAMLQANLNSEERLKAHIKLLEASLAETPEERTKLEAEATRFIETMSPEERMKLEVQIAAREASLRVAS